jgi:hypothetical protein
MKNITSSLSGLTSSLLLNVGLAQVAQKLDPISGRAIETQAEAHGPALCFPSEFTATGKSRR